MQNAIHMLVGSVHAQADLHACTINARTNIRVLNSETGDGGGTTACAHRMCSVC